MNSTPAISEPRSPRRRVVFLLPILAALAPAVAFYFSLRGAESGKPLSSLFEHLHELLILPGVYPGLMFRSVIVTLLAAGLYWYLVAFTLLAALFLPKPPCPRESEGIYVRPLIWLALALLAYTALIVRMALGWNPD
jgi:hypothetical protein